ncbi:DUF4439 domain-containing protein [Sinomonas halotolerans]|uniref:DUF4439 domain-containing protein n=1 Tax=Sinomonas halotolerans TaxID=1644133 RepID=A0ABU9WVE0_9MICC
MAAVTAAVVLGTGAALAAAPAPSAPAASPEEVALAQAEDDADRLVSVADTVAAASSGPTAQAARRVAGVLRLQASVLSDRPQLPTDPASAPAATAGPSSASASVPTPPATSPSATSPSPAAGPAAQAAGLAADLDRSAAAIVDRLDGLDGPTASVLGSVAAARTAAARSLAPAGPRASGGSPTGGQDGAQPMEAQAGQEPEAAQASEGLAGTACPAPTPATAWEAVHAAESAAEWAYTVLAARAEGAERTARLDSAAAHARQAEALAGIAAASCVSLPAREPAFALEDPAPRAALLVERAAAESWAQLVGAAPPAQRAAAAGRLAEAALLLAAHAPQTPAEAAFPGHAAAQTAASAPAAG